MIVNGHRNVIVDSKKRKGKERGRRGKAKNGIIRNYFNGSSNNGEEECDVAKIQIYEVTGFVSIFRRNKTKKLFAKNQRVSANWSDITTVML